MSRSILRLSKPPSLTPSEIVIPGSKSYTNRALVLSALAEGQSILNSASLSDDSRALISALERLGVRFESSSDQIKVTGRGGRFLPYKGEIDVGAAGTSMRFLVPLCALSEGTEIILKGSERMHQRPIRDLVEALKIFGAEIEYLAAEGCPPLRIKGKGGLAGGSVGMRGDKSSQYFSSLLMAAPLFKGGLEVEVLGVQISRSYIDMTFDSLRSFGVAAQNADYERYVVAADSLPKACRYQVEGDASGASYFWGLAAAGCTTIRTLNINPDSSQGDVRFPKLLKEMGCEVASGVNGETGWIEVVGKRPLKGLNIDMSLMPDTAQTLAMIAALASGPSTITGLSTLRIKETDRINAVHTELKRLGIASETGPDFIRIFPGSLKAGRIKTYEDHRMAMSFAVLSACVDGIEIEDPEVVNKSFPGFWEYLKKVGIEGTLRT